MKIVCDNCSTKYSIADEKVRGKVFKIKCKKCSHIIVVKGQEATGEGAPAGFDQKETRVFDYSGFEGQKEGAGAEPIWHLVIDREQVGPLTVAEVLQKWKTSEIDRDTYAWREGFADWQRLGQIDELAGIMGRPSAQQRAQAAVSDEHAEHHEEGQTTSADAGPAGLFGDGGATPAAGVPSISGSSADPTDLFAGAGSSTEDEVATDLFGAGRAAASAPPAVFSSAAPAPARRSAKEDLYGDSGGGLSVSGDADEGGGVSMTGQRNENSVLFSLNNLSALAAEPSPSPSARPSSLGSGSSFAAGGAEGSGLIDIRAMAAMTLGATSKKEEGPRSSRSSSSDDDLPVFSASSFSAPAAGVLLPTVQPQSNRMMYIFMGVVGLLAIAAIVLVAVILLGKKAPPAAALVTEPAITHPEATTPPSATPPSVTTPPSATPPSATPPAATPPSATPAVTPTREPTKPEPRKPPRTPTERPSEPTAKPPTEPSRPAAEPTPSKPPAEPAPKPQKCDEVACLVSPDLPCCPKKQANKPAPSAADSSLADRLDQSDIIAGMKAVNGRVMACNDRFRVPGNFKVKVTVNADGAVTAASATPPVGGSPAASCVEGAVRSARFKRTKNAITFNYPYTFR